MCPESFLSARSTLRWIIFVISIGVCPEFITVNNSGHIPIETKDNTSRLGLFKGVCPELFDILKGVCPE